MKYTGKKLSELLSNPDLVVNAVLLYGPDQGLVREYSKSISLKCTKNLTDPFAITEFTGAYHYNGQPLVPKISLT